MLDLSIHLRKGATSYNPKVTVHHYTTVHSVQLKAEDCHASDVLTFYCDTAEGADTLAAAFVACGGTQVNEQAEAAV